MPQGHEASARQVQEGEEGQQAGRVPKATLHGLGKSIEASPGETRATLSYASGGGASG
jgi:hypothetical protein